MSTNTRLVVELGPRALGALEYATALEDLNKTTVTNRALQLYEMVLRTQEDKGAVLFRAMDGSTSELRFL